MWVLNPRTPRASHILTSSSRPASPASLRAAFAPPTLLRLGGSCAPREAHEQSLWTGAQTDGPGDASARASRAGYVDCPTGVGWRDQHSSARGPGGQRGL